MAYLIDQQLSSLKLKRFNGIRRTKEGMLYLSSTDPNSESDDIHCQHLLNLANQI